MPSVNRFSWAETHLSGALISAGLIDGVTYVAKFGRNLDCDSAATEVIHSLGGGINYIDAASGGSGAQVHDLASTSDNDGAGTEAGAATVRVFGLDANYDFIQEDVTLNGLTDATTTNSYIDIYRMRVLTTGSYNTNIGTISATADTDGTVTAEIPADRGSTERAVMTCPRNSYALVVAAYASTLKGSAAAGVDISLRVRSATDGTVSIYNETAMHTANQPSEGQIFAVPAIVPEKATVYLAASVSADNVLITGGFEMLFLDKDAWDGWAARPLLY